MISIYEFRPLLLYFTALAAMTGAAMGSFLNCAAWRTVRGESFLTGRSRCPSCGHVLGPAELVPVISWLFLGGRCRACGERIPARYPLTELAAALITVLCLLRFDLTALCLRNYIFLCCLFFLTLTDLESMIIPDGCHIAAVCAWVLALPFTFSDHKHILVHILTGFAAGGIVLLVSSVLDKILGRESLGGGDVKLLAVTGLYLGPVGTLFTIMFSSALGLLFHAFAHSSPAKREADGVKRTDGTMPDEAAPDAGAFPFGPFIAVSAGAMLLFGDPLIRWYSGLLGM